MMWRNYLTVAVRALAKNRTYAFINIFGLAVGLAACLMLLVYVEYERSYDSWLPNSENLYQVQSRFTDPETGEVTRLQMSPYPAGRTLAQDFPRVERRVYALNSRPVVLRGAEAVAVDNGIMVDGPFFDVVQLPLLHGDARTALVQAGSVALSESQARRLFNTDAAVGRTITVSFRGQRADRRVTAVFRDLPRNSHMRLNYIERIDINSYFADTPEWLTQWGGNSGWNYVALRPGTDPATLQAGFAAWERRNIPDQQFGGQRLNQGDIADWSLANVRDVHLGEHQDASMTPGNDERTILTFGIVAFLILGMACVNFTNLATARASQRAREVALRKVLGANRRQLMTQFLAESILVAAFSMLLALAMVELMLPLLSGFMEADLSMAYFGSGGMLLPILLLTLLVGAAGGLYPAIYLSRFQPAQVLRANKSSAEPSGSGTLRGTLVIAQFAVSIGLMICTAVVYAQTVYARTADPGYQRNGILQIEGIGRRQLVERSEALVREIERIPGVVSVGRTGIGIDTDNQIVTGIYMPGRQRPVNMGIYDIDEGFFRTMGMPLVAGRQLDADRPADIDIRIFSSPPSADADLVRRGLNVIVNELGARRLGFSDPRQAVGARMRGAFVRQEYGLVPVTIVGVVGDTRFRSIRQPAEPIMYSLGVGALTHMLVRYEPGQAQAVRGRIEQAWRRLAPDVPFQADFSENIVAELYDTEEARAQIFAAFALLAIVVACLGLFGLAAFTAERRTKEIGVRKVLGARSRDIVRLLAWQFSKPVIIANLIAWPVAWWVMRDWLNTFDARIDLGPAPFLLAGALALLIAIGTIAGHALRVARANPILALRYE